MLGFGTERPLVVQLFRTFAFAAGVTALPLEPTLDKTKLITTFMISNPSAGASVFLGNEGVTTATGLEIQSGTNPVFSIDNQGRQMYEIQGLLADITEGLSCRHVNMEKIPFVVWDLSRIFVVAAGAVNISVGVFPTMYL